ncbi:MAG: Protein transport protein S9 plasma membrane t-SNARE [Thelocarpon impressellum]|nr:MAG: Protein transport protein S9 plasma membrane t-SNARE [Thelocarpon impressellum]
MKKFGMGKKAAGGDEGEDSNRSALFGSRSGKKSAPGPASSNPYAQPQDGAAADPYVQDNNKYANMGGGYGGGGGGGGYGGPGSSSGGASPAPRGSLGGPVRPGGNGPSRNGSSGGPTGGAPGGYGGPGYGADRYGNQGGYGGDKYGSGGASGAGSSRYGPSGYGGLGRSDSNDTAGTEEKRDALFGGAKDRYQQKSRPPQQGGPPGPPGAGYGEDGGAPGGYGADSGYGAYGEERQLTAEEAEEEDVQATKQQIRFMKQEDVGSTRNALRIAAQAEETGRATLERLGAQGERIYNTEKNLDLAANHNRVAEDRAKELKTLNKSMFSVHVGNPFTSASRREKRDDDIMAKHRQEREERDATRQAAYDGKSRVEGAFKGMQPGDAGYQAKQKSSLAERAKYQFEADSEDEEMENEIDSNLDALSGAAARLNVIARATGKEVDEQNVHIERIHGKSDKVDDMIHMNRKRLDRIH